MFPTQYPNNPIGFPGLGIEVNPNPVAFHVLGRDIYWYGIIIAVAFLLAALYTIRRTQYVGIRQDDFIDALLVAVPVAIVFARLYYIVFNLKEFQLSPENPNPQKFYEIWKGGIAIYGAVIGAVLAVFVVSRIKKIKLSAIMDIGVIGLIIGQCIGRWGNFVNREAFGTPTDIFCRMEVYVEKLNNKFVGQRLAVHPTFLYESLWCLIGFFILHFTLKRRKFNGQIFLMYMAWYGLGRGLIEGLRTDSLYVMNTNLRVSQFVAVVSCLVALGLLIYNLLIKPHDPEELVSLAMMPSKQEKALTADVGDQDAPEPSEPNATDEGEASQDETENPAEDEYVPADTEEPADPIDGKEDNT